jgi:tripartite-type tricarboxylate transporter receptor subunit TctC
MQRRKVTAALLSTLGLALTMGSAQAQDYPTQPIRLIVPYGAGTATDTLARILARKLSATWTEGVIVENVTGAGGVIGTQQLQRAAPNGYTLGLLASGHAMNPALYPKLPFDPINDFTPVMQLAETAMVLMSPAGSYGSLKTLISTVKSKPGRVDYGSTGNGSLPHLTVELLRVMSDLHMVHIPYRNTGAMMPDLIAGRVTLAAVAIPTALSHAASGKLEALAVSTPRRSKFMPDVPSVSELVPGYDVSPWIGLVGPKGLPPQIVAKLQAEVTKAMQSDEVLTSMGTSGLEPNVRDGTSFWNDVRQEVPKWQNLVKASGIKAD